MTTPAGTAMDRLTAVSSSQRVWCSSSWSRPCRSCPRPCPWCRSYPWSRDVVRVVAERERSTPERLVPRVRLGLGEFPDRPQPDRAFHQRPPDLSGEAPSRDGDAVDVVHRDLAGLVPHPHRGREVGCVAHEPRVRVLVRRPGLAGGGTADGGPDARAVPDVVLEDLRHLPCDTVGDDSLPLRGAPARTGVLLPVRQHDLPDRARLRVDAAGRERRVRRRHVERRHGDRAEAHGGHVAPAHLERRPNPEPPRHLADSVRSHVQRQLRVHRVVRPQRGPRDGRPAVVGRVVRLHTPPRSVVAIAVRDRLVRERGRDVVAGIGIDPLFDRSREDERLERRAGLPAGLREQIELVVAAAGNHGRHRTDRTVAGIDRDDGSRRVLGVGERLLDGFLGGTLPAGHDRRVDAQAP